MLGRLAVELADALEEAPGYSKARLAHELRECIAGLQQRADELEELRGRRERRERQRAWAAVENGG